MPHEMIILEGDRLKGRQSPIIWVDYTPPGSKIGYLVPWVGDGMELEEICDLLGELVEKYHPGLGQKAFDAAREQLETRDYAAEWLAIKKKKAAYRRFGGHPPAAVLVPDPDDAKALWNLIIPEHDGLGDIVVSKVRREVTADFPRPEEGVTAYHDEFGWKARPSKQEAARRRWNRAFAKAQMRGATERRIVVE